MATDTEIRVKGLNALTKALGDVEAERFVTPIMREHFDYTKWRKDLRLGETVEEISRHAMEYRSRAGTRRTKGRPTAAVPARHGDPRS
jgi:hypothetical protein